MPVLSSLHFLILGSVQVQACYATLRSRDSSSICASLQVINSTTMQRLSVADNSDKTCLTNVSLWFISHKISCRNHKYTLLTFKIDKDVHLSGLFVVALHFIYSSVATETSLMFLSALQLEEEKKAQIIHGCA